jgi:hypothetical protein
MLVRHAGASRFAYNQCLRLVADAFAAKRIDPDVKIPWSGFDLINAYNAWKCDEAAGRVFVAAPDGTIVKRVTGLAWRHEISAQVFEEAAADLGRALSEFTRAKSGNLKGRRVGFPKWKRKGRCRDSFRFRNKKGNGGASSIRVGEGHPRSVTLPTIGVVRVHDQTRRLRRLLRPVEHVDPDTGQLVVAPRAKVLSATVNRHGSRWYVCLNVRAPDFHAGRRHQLCASNDDGKFVGVDRGLHAFAVAATADGSEVGRFQAARPLRDGMVGLGSVWRTLPSPTSWPTTVWPALSATPPGASWLANSATRRHGSELNWLSATVGSPLPRPASGAARSSNRWSWSSGSTAATAAAWPSTATATPPRTSLPGPSIPIPRPRTAKRAAGSSTPLEGRALAIASAMAEPAPAKGEPCARLLA